MFPQWVPKSSGPQREVYRPLKMRDLGQQLKNQNVHVFWDEKGEEGWYRVEIQRVRHAFIRAPIEARRVVGNVSLSSVHSSAVSF